MESSSCKSRCRRFESCRGHSTFTQISEGFQATTLLFVAPLWSVLGRCFLGLASRALVPDGQSSCPIETPRDVVEVGREKACVVVKRGGGRFMSQQTSHSHN